MLYTQIFLARSNETSVTIPTVTVGAGVVGVDISSSIAVVLCDSTMPAKEWQSVLNTQCMQVSI